MRLQGRVHGPSRLETSSGVIVYLSQGWAVPPAFLQRRGCSRDVNTLFEEVMSHAHARHARYTHAVCQCASRQQLWPVSHRVACAIVSFLAARGTKAGLRSSSARHRRRSRPCICDQACGPPTLSVETPLVGKISAALPRDGRESRRRETGDHMPGRRCLHDFAGGAVVKMPRLQGSL